MKGSLLSGNSTEPLVIKAGGSVKTRTKDPTKHSKKSPDDAITAVSLPADLLTAARDGDPRATATVLSWLQPRITAHARRHLSAGYPDVDPEDVTQQTLMALVTQRQAWESTNRLMALAHTIAKRRCIEQHRRAEHRHRDPAEEPPDLPGVEPDLLRRRECAEKLKPILELLSDRDRLVLWLSIAEGLSAAKVADRTGMTPGTVRVTKHRALKAIREGRSTRRRELAPCGTTAAYNRHYAHGEKPCQACRVAHNTHDREYRRRKSPPGKPTGREVKPCGMTAKSPRDGAEHATGATKSDREITRRVAAAAAVSGGVAAHRTPPGGRLSPPVHDHQRPGHGHVQRPSR